MKAFGTNLSKEDTIKEIKSFLSFYEEKEILKFNVTESEWNAFFSIWYNQLVAKQKASIFYSIMFFTFEGILQMIIQEGLKEVTLLDILPKIKSFLCLSGFSSEECQIIMQKIYLGSRENCMIDFNQYKELMVRR